MSIQPVQTHKNRFKTGLKPLQQHFWDIFDSYRHKSDKVPVADVEGLDEAIGNHHHDETYVRNVGARFWNMAKAFYGLFSFENITANWTYSFPNKSGTIALVDDIPNIPTIPDVPDAGFGLKDEDGKRKLDLSQLPVFVWQLVTITVPTTPSVGQIRFNNYPISDGSRIYIHKTMYNALGHIRKVNFLKDLSEGDIIYLQSGEHTNNGTDYNFYGELIVSSVTDHGDYVEIVYTLADNAFVQHDSGILLQLQFIPKGGGTSQPSATGLPSTWEADVAAIRLLNIHDNGMDVGNYATGAIYEYSETESTADDGDVYLKPDDVSGDGRWIKKKVFSVNGHLHNLSEVTPSAGNAKRFIVVDENGNAIGYTNFTYDTVLSTTNVDVSDIAVGEKKILTVEKLADGTAVVSEAIAQLDKLGAPTLSAHLDETNPLWDGDEISITGDNLSGALGENSQEYRIGSDFFLCTAHSNGTTSADGWATWVRNRGQDSLTPGIAHDDLIIAELEDIAGWSTAGFKQINSKSKKGTWFRRSTGGAYYACIDKNNGWTKLDFPDTTTLEITSTSHPILTANLSAHDFATNGMYDESLDATNEEAEQGQEYWDTANNAWYKRNMNGYWAKMT